VHVDLRPGKLTTVTAEAPEANRPWDGRRLLRFLTGLAMLALAVTLRLPGPVAAEPVPPAAAVAVAEPAAVAEAAPARRRERAEPAPPASVPADAVAPEPAAILLTTVPSTGDSRAPPIR
jgi:hypothetical protein